VSSVTPPFLQLPSRAIALLEDFQRAQRRSHWLLGALVAVPTVFGLILGAGLLGPAAPLTSKVLLYGSPLFFFAAAASVSWALSWRRVKTLESTARFLAAEHSEFRLDLLAAVELAQGPESQASPELAQAFLAQLDASVSPHSGKSLLDATPVRRAALIAIALTAALFVVAGLTRERLKRGYAMAAAPLAAVAAKSREPIVGDLEVTYRYPAYTGLETQTVSGADIVAPVGTSVSVSCQADRDVEKAALIVNGQPVPLTVADRKLKGEFIASESGQYRVVFLSGQRTVAEGPDNSLTVKPDAAPQVSLSAPEAEREIMPDENRVTLKYVASDEYGLSSLALVYRVGGGEAQRIALRPDAGRVTRQDYQWDFGALQLRDGQVISYFIEAQDNNSLKGPQRGVSVTQRLTRYSAEAHRREALKRAEALWERLLIHVADRIESGERTQATSSEASQKSKPIDARALTLAQDFLLASKEMFPRKEIPEALVSALDNIYVRLNSNTGRIASLRRLADGTSAGGARFKEKTALALRKSVWRDLALGVTKDITDGEADVLYLEALINREKIEAIQSLANELKESRKELTKLIDEFARTKDPQTQEAISKEMKNLRERMKELEQKMAALSKGMRDEFMNQEAMEEMLAEQDMSSKMDEIEKLLSESRIEEAMKKMQELSMQMDEFLDNLDEAADSAEQNVDPELAKQFEEFNQNLDRTVKDQETVAQDTKILKEKYAALQKQRIDAQGAALKALLQEKLAGLKASLQKSDEPRFGSQWQDKKGQSLKDATHVEEAIKANDFSLALQAAEELERSVEESETLAKEQRLQDELYQNPKEVQKNSKALEARAKADAQSAREIAGNLRELFPAAGQEMVEADREKSKALSKRQDQLEQRAQQLSEQMESLNEKAPILNDDAKKQMSSAQENMGKAAQRLQGRDPQRGFGNQESALESLKQIQQGMEQSGQGKRNKHGLPMPMRQKGRGRDQNERVEIPEEDPNSAARAFRKDVVDAMKQGAPDKYREQNKKYYEELVQ
jgi:hypothetical protein